jgi:hypothetical protein
VVVGVIQRVLVRFQPYLRTRRLCGASGQQRSRTSLDGMSMEKAYRQNIAE